MAKQQKKRMRDALVIAMPVGEPVATKDIRPILKKRGIEVVHSDGTPFDDTQFASNLSNYLSTRKKAGEFVSPERGIYQRLRLPSPDLLASHIKSQPPTTSVSHARVQPRKTRKKLKKAPERPVPATILPLIDGTSAFNLALDLYPMEERAAVREDMLYFCCLQAHAARDAANRAMFVSVQAEVKEYMPALQQASLTEIMAGRPYTPLDRSFLKSQVHGQVHGQPENHADHGIHADHERLNGSGEVAQEPLHS